MNVGVYGASGYTGQELIRLLARHSQAKVIFATSETHADRRLDTLHPQLPPIELVDPATAPLDKADFVFLCLPHGAAAGVAVEALDAGARVIDLSADFRLRDAASYEQWYGAAHPAPALLAEAVYGLTEIAREAIGGARLVANPGCYPTSVLLALYPLAQAGIAAGRMIIDAKSGVSGAGRTPKQHTHFVEVADNLTPYNIGRTHRHLPEMEQVLRSWGAADPALIFSPHLLPVPRGLLSTIYVPLAPGWNEGSLRDLFREHYDGEPFIQLLGQGEHATLAHAVGSNRCAIGLHVADGSLILTSAIDNLIKGASGQAVQNMNRMIGCPETEGICWEVG